MKSRLPLLALIAGVVTLDTICTLLCANPSYWTNYSDYGMDLNPLALWTLHQGPPVYVLHCILWMAMITLLVLKTPRKVGFVIGTFFLVAHSAAVTIMIGWLLQTYVFPDWNFTIVIHFTNIFTTFVTLLFVWTSMKFFGLKFTKIKTRSKNIN